MLPFLFLYYLWTPLCHSSYKLLYILIIYQFLLTLSLFNLILFPLYISPDIHRSFTSLSFLSLTILDRQVWANSLDPDQTAPSTISDCSWRSLIRVYTFCNSTCTSWTHFCFLFDFMVFFYLSFKTSWRCSIFTGFSCLCFFLITTCSLFTTVYTICHSVCIFQTHFSIVKLLDKILGYCLGIYSFFCCCFFDYSLNSLRHLIITFFYLFCLSLISIWTLPLHQSLCQQESLLFPFPFFHSDPNLRTGRQPVLTQIRLLPKSSLIRIYTVCHSVCAPFGHISLRLTHFVKKIGFLLQFFQVFNFFNFYDIFGTLFFTSYKLMKMFNIYQSFLSLPLFDLILFSLYISPGNYRSLTSLSFPFLTVMMLSFQTDLSGQTVWT